MRAFAQTENDSRHPESSRFERATLSGFGSVAREQSIAHSLRALSDQPAHRLSPPHPAETDTGARSTGKSRPTHDLSRIPIYPRVPGAIQTKLAIGHPWDRYEQEADRIAEHVVRMPEPQLQRKCACGGTCPDCEKEPKAEHGRLQKQHESGRTSVETEAPPLVHEVLRSPGRPLDAAARAFMEPRFERDFSGVRIHSGSDAEWSAADMNAHAYTVRHNIVFARGRFAPETPEGRRLLAHELTHVLQQSGADRISGQPSRDRSARVVHQLSAPGPRLQRACGPSNFRGKPDCIGRGGDITNFGGDSSKIFKFHVNCDELLPGEQERVKYLASTLFPTEDMMVDGFASEEGPAGFNEALSCARAKAVARGLNEADVRSSRIEALYMHGATHGDPENHRSAVVTTPWRPTPPENCSDLVGDCEFYMCRERKHACGDGYYGYYKAYGYKYCNRFSRLAPRLSVAGRNWVRKTLRCLHEYIDRNVPLDAPCPQVKQSAFDSHPDCYVTSGVCFLDLNDLIQIVGTIDPPDNDLKQVLVTGIDCVANVAPLALMPQLGLAAGGGFHGQMERDFQRNFHLPPPLPRN